MADAETSQASNTQRRSRLPIEQRRSDILRTGARLFQQRGYTGVSIDDIGAALGVTGPAVYRYVDGKQGLLCEIAVGMADLLVKEAEKIIAMELAPDATIDGLITSMAAQCLRYPSETAVCLRHMWSLDDDHQPTFFERWNVLTDLWAPAVNAVRPGLSRADAGLYVRAGTGLVMGSARSTSSVPRTRLIEIVSSMLRAMLDVQLEPTPVGGDPIADDASGGWERSSRREQLLSAAIALFRARGFRGVSLAQIAQEVGVTASAAYRHFKNKEDILATGIDRAGDRMTLGLDEALKNATSAHDALDRLLVNYIRIGLENRDLIAVSTSEYHHLPDELRQRRRKRQQLFNDEWTHCMATTHHWLSRAEAAAVVNGIIGMLTEVARSASLGRRQRLADDLYQLAHASLMQA